MIANCNCSAVGGHDAHKNLVFYDYLVADENGAPPHRLVPKDKQALAQQILVRQKAVELEEIGDRDEAHAVRD